MWRQRPRFPSRVAESDIGAFARALTPVTGAHKDRRDSNRRRSIADGHHGRLWGGAPAIRVCDISVPLRRTSRRNNRALKGGVRGRVSHKPEMSASIQPVVTLQTTSAHFELEPATRADVACLHDDYSTLGPTLTNRSSHILTAFGEFRLSAAHRSGVVQMQVFVAARGCLRKPESNRYCPRRAVRLLSRPRRNRTDRNAAAWAFATKLARSTTYQLREDVIACPWVPSPPPELSFSRSKVHALELGRALSMTPFRSFKSAYSGR